MPRSVEQWWNHRQYVTGSAVPSPVGRFRDAWAPFTALVEQYRPDRNHDLVLSQIPPAADVYLVWVCSVGHEFVATPAEQRGRPGRSRSSRSWCPVCSTPLLLPAVSKWPRVSPTTASETGTRQGMSARRPRDPSPNRARLETRSASDVRPGEAFWSDRAPRATSATEGRLRALIAERLDVDLSATAIRVRSPFFGRGEVWPDIIVPELAVAIELDTVGRNGDEHVGRREQADRRKNQLLAEVGWQVVRIRLRPLRALGPHDLVVAGVSNAAVEQLIDRMGDIRGHLFVAAYRRPNRRQGVGGSS